MSTVTTNLGLFKYDPAADAQTAFSITNALNNNWDIIDNNLTSSTILQLGTSGTLTLTDNKVHKISSVSGTVTFSLPTISDNTKFHQILVQLYMSSVYSINLGTSNYFNASAPSMTQAGYYTIIWEYDSIRGGWSVGAARKA